MHWETYKNMHWVDIENMFAYVITFPNKVSNELALSVYYTNINLFSYN